MTVTLRLASSADAAALMPWVVALNRGEHITTPEPAIRAGLDRLLADPGLGRLWWIEEPASAIGYAIVTFGYDLEYAGRDAYLTELFVAPAARQRGAGSLALAAILAAMPALEVHALHLQCRRDNPVARAVYDRAGFVETPRAFMTRLIP